MNFRDLEIKGQTDNYGHIQVTNFSAFIKSIQNASEKLVNKVLSLLRGIDELNGEIKFMSIQDCEGADFSGANICYLYGLMSVSTKGTPNNFVDTVDCEFDVAKEYLFLMKEK